MTLARLCHQRQVRCALLSGAEHPLTTIFICIYIHNVECLVLFTDEFQEWWNILSIEE